jgi:hypothetical protein
MTIPRQSVGRLLHGLHLDIANGSAIECIRLALRGFRDGISKRELLRVLRQ